MSYAHLTPQARKQNAGKCFKAATKAIASQNWDLAIKLLSNAMRLAPDTLTYRQTLRGSQRKKYHDQPDAACKSASMLAGIRLWIKQARADKNWIELDRAAEEGLALNPWNAQFHADVGDAAREQGFLDVARFSFEQAIALTEANNCFLISLVDIYEMQQRYKSAIATLKRVFQVDPLSGEVHSRIQRLTSELQRSRSASIVTESKPETSVNCDPGSCEQSEDVELESMRHQLVIATEKGDSNPADETSRQLIAKLTNDLALREVDIFSRRIEQDPSDLKSKYELARGLMKLKEFHKAIPLLQAAFKDPRLEQQVLRSLSRCFSAMHRK